MEIFSNLIDVSPSELNHAQRCCLYLGVTTVADITVSNGLDICGWALQGQHAWPSQHIFPCQECPSSRIWKTWNTLLRHGYCQHSAGKLDRTLGPWYHGKISQVWNTVLDPLMTLIYI